MEATCSQRRQKNNISESGFTRTVSEADARSRRIRLSEDGLGLVDRLMGRHVANEARLVSGFTADERSQLADLLRRWGQSLE